MTRLVILTFSLFIATGSTSTALAQVTAGRSSAALSWTLQGSFPDPGGRTDVAEGGQVSITPRPPAPDASANTVVAGSTGRGTSDAGGLAGAVAPRPPGTTPNCSRSPVCDNHLPAVGTKTRQQLQRVEWRQTLGYRFSYPYTLPRGFGGLPAVALDSKGNLWAYKRSPAGTPQLYEFDRAHRLVRQIGDDVIGHSIKAHGMAIDTHDNIWITDAARAIVNVVSPDGKLVKTIGEAGQRGDWDEAKGHRLLWEPLMVAFGAAGDVYIGEGHGNESPNDTDSDDPLNQSGAARVIHLDSEGKFVEQWYGNNVGEGKFSMVHGLAVDPRNGDVWIGDREQYRIAVYSAHGQFIKTLQMRNLVCALLFDSHGNPWMGSGQDGQFLKLDRSGTVLGAIGNGMGIGPGQFIEASYFVIDKHDNLYAGDTSVGRITVLTAAKD